MIQTKQVEAVCTAEIVTDVLCNCCGGSCKTDPGYLIYEYALIEASWGYGSAAPWDKPEQMSRDMELHQAHLCQSCYETMIQPWKFPPEVREAGRSKPFTRLETDSADELDHRKSAAYYPVHPEEDKAVSELLNWLRQNQQRCTKALAATWFAAKGYDKETCQQLVSRCAK